MALVVREGLGPMYITDATNAKESCFSKCDLLTIILESYKDLYSVCN